MNEILSYRELDVWKQSRLLVGNIYQLTKKFPKEEQFGLTNQMRRAAVSIPSNIAEGCGRNHYRDSIQFFFVARGSLYELETQLIVAADLDLVSSDELELNLDQVVRCKKLLNGFIKYFEKQANNNQPTTINEIIEQYGNSNTN
ncbi:MAG: four helix bundle protein [Flammeovirgaceae bacterium]|nr:four helix bundle protein [Flammeovirgaceae bacterium]